MIIFPYNTQTFIHICSQNAHAIKKGKEINNMHKSSFSTNTDNYFENTQNTAFSNCHRTGKKHIEKPASKAEETDSDQDSTNSKYLVEDDNRERKDGPGGN